MLVKGKHEREPPVDRRRQVGFTTSLLGSVGTRPVDAHLSTETSRPRSRTAKHVGFGCTGSGASRGRICRTSAASCEYPPMVPAARHSADSHFAESAGMADDRSSNRETNGANFPTADGAGQALNV